MFDMNKVAGNIKAARMKKNMTQMNLADKMAEEVADINFGQLCALAPFLDKSTLDKIGTGSGKRRRPSGLSG